jgi:hypothetical protein
MGAVFFLGFLVILFFVGLILLIVRKASRTRKYTSAIVFMSILPGFIVLINIVNLFGYGFPQKNETYKYIDTGKLVYWEDSGAGSSFVLDGETYLWLDMIGDEDSYDLSVAKEIRLGDPIANITYKPEEGLSKVLSRILYWWGEFPMTPDEIRPVLQVPDGKLCMVDRFFYYRYRTRDDFDYWKQKYRDPSAYGRIILRVDGSDVGGFESGAQDFETLLQYPLNAFEIKMEGEYGEMFSHPIIAVSTDGVMECLLMYIFYYDGKRLQLNYAQSKKAEDGGYALFLNLSELTADQQAIVDRLFENLKTEE